VTEGGEACPVCGSHAPRAIDLVEYALHRCGGCGAWSSDAALRGAVTSFEPERYFENAALDRDRWRALLSHPARGDASPASALDVGCGTGEYLAFLAAELPACRRAAIELDAARAAAARARDPSADIRVGDALASLASLPGRFDLITLWDVFEHVPAPSALLAALADRLAPGGCICLQTIHEHSLAPALGRWSYRLSGGRLRALARRTHEPHHLVFFTRRSLEWSARAARLRVRALWFDRLARGRMDGPALLTALTALALRAENALGGGLFVNLLLARD
jgi:2-polyprenyl-3-methyl-5-hydroxy-6-metoxy-1,4-benzoquinol methylase